MMTLKSLTGDTGLLRLDRLLKAAPHTDSGQWIGAGTADLGARGNAKDAAVKALIVEALHPNLDTLLPQYIADGLSAETALSKLRLGRRTTNLSPTRPPKLGYELIFAPAKSISLAAHYLPYEQAAMVNAAHQTAVEQTFTWIETMSAVTRLNTKRVVRQAPSHGFVAAALNYTLSAAANPQLATHVLISNRVTLDDGRWMSLDGKVLHSIATAASSLYDTLVEHRIRDTLGYQFENRTSSRGAVVRDLVGINSALIDSASLTTEVDQTQAEISLKVGAAATVATRRKLDQWAVAEATRRHVNTTTDDLGAQFLNALTHQPQPDTADDDQDITQANKDITEDMDNRRTWGAARGYSRIFRALAPAAIQPNQTVLSVADTAITQHIDTSIRTKQWSLYAPEILYAARQYIDTGRATAAVILTRTEQ